MLKAQYTSKYEHDVKALVKKHCDIAPFSDVVDLILEDTAESKHILQQYNMHALKGA